MLYLREKTSEHDDKHIYLIEYCRRCGYENESFELTDSSSDTTSASASASASRVTDRFAPPTRGIIVYEKSYEKNYVQPRIDEIAFGDPAVPTTTEVICPNEKCDSKRDSVKASAKYIVLNPDTYSILYKCTHCSEVWKNKN